MAHSSLFSGAVVRTCAQVFAAVPAQPSKPPHPPVHMQGSGESGRLGSGSNASSSTPAEVAGVYKFAVIATGQAHACALTPEGQAWCCESEGVKC